MAYAPPSNNNRSGGRGKNNNEGGRGGRNNRNDSRDARRDDNPFNEKVVAINRVAKVVKGGRRFSFTALVVIGDGDGQVGVGYGKAKEVPQAIQKGIDEAKKSMFFVPRIQGTITHPVIGHDGAGEVVLKPAAPGTGVIAGGAVRAVLECAGISDVLAKSLGTANHINVVHATVDGLRQLKRPEDVAEARGLAMTEFMPKKMLDNYGVKSTPVEPVEEDS